MPYLITGTYESIFKSFGKDQFIQLDSSGAGAQQIHLDLSRQKFLGNKQACMAHINVWSNNMISDPQYFVQGNMDSSILAILFGDYSIPLRSTGESVEDHAEHATKLCFAFVDEGKERILSALSIFYRKDDPKQWVISLVKKTNKLPSEREVLILTSFKPVCKAEPLCEIEKFEADPLPLIKSAKHPIVECILNNIFSSTGKINTHIDTLELITQNPRNKGYQENSALLDQCPDIIPSILKNRFLHTAKKHKIALSPQNVLDCIDKKSQLHKFLASNGNFEERILLIGKLKELELDNSYIDLLADNGPKGQQFFKLVSEVEKRCHQMMERLGKTAHTHPKYTKMNIAEKHYKARIYTLLYDQLTDNTKLTQVELKKKIYEAEAPFLKVADEDRHPYIRYTFAAITNLLSMLCMGIPLLVHYRNTGDFFFFARTRSSQNIHSLSQEVSNIMDPPISVN